MALIAAPGGVDSNSFATVEDALLAHIGRTGAAAWAAADPEVQEATLIAATQDIALKVSWLDEMVDPLVQALPLPMVEQVDQYGRLLAEDIIPPLVVQATAWYALILYNETAIQARIPQGVKQVNVQGDVAITFSDTAQVLSTERATLPAVLWSLLMFYGAMPAMAGRRLAVYRG